MSEETVQYTSLVNDSYREEEEETDTKGDDGGKGREMVDMERGGKVEEDTQKMVAEKVHVENSVSPAERREEEEEEREEEEEEEEREEAKEEEEQDEEQKKEKEVAEEEKCSDVNLATPRSELASLEFFDHNVTSSDSSDVRVGSGRWGVEGEEGEQGEEGSEEVVRSKLAWDRKMEAAKLLDLESPVDTRREVSGEVEDTRDLKATITHREKQGTRTDSYINYRIVTQTTRPSHLYEESHYIVWRRYRDFVWLRLQIERMYPTLILPPLPGKQVARYFDHMSETFLEERQRALGKFLWRLTAHPYFSFSTDLKVFLTASIEDFAGHVQSQGGKKLLGKVSASMRHAHTALMLKDADSEFAKQAVYFSDLGEKMSVLERIVTRLHEEQEMLQLAYDDFSVSLFHWAANEQVMSQSLQKVAACVEKCSHLLKKLNKDDAYSMLVSVKEYQLYAASAVAAIRRRDALQLEEERSAIDHDKKRRHHQEATAAGKVQRVTKLSDELEKVGLAAEKAHDELSQANEQLRVDIEKWHEAKNKEVCQFMRQFATNHREYHQKCFSEWESALKRLKATSTSSHDQQLTDMSSSHSAEENSIQD